MREALALRDVRGDWRRSLLAFDGRPPDMSSSVRWLQGPSLFCDLRQPPPFLRIETACLRALSMEEVVALAAQKGFAGRLVRQGQIFEWIRWLDYQPASALRDRATLAWRDDVLIETGLEVAYVEHWHRDDDRPGPTSAFHLVDAAAGRAAILVVASDRFAYARQRATHLDAGRTLRDVVLRAPTLALAQDMVDCEISYGAREGWIIERSTLPWRAGRALNVRREATGLVLDDVDPEGRAYRAIYRIVEEEAA